MSQFDGKSDQNEPSGKILVTVKIDADKYDDLVISPSDSPRVLAKQFAIKHSLDSVLEKALEKVIAVNKKPMELPPKPRTADTRSKKPQTASEKPGSNIHTRLYMDSKYKSRKHRADTQPVFHEKQSAYRNYGNYLYQQAKPAENSKWKSNMSLKLSLQQESDKELTFHPQLPHSESTSHISGSDFFNRSKAISRNPEKSISTRELEECSFRPKIHSQIRSTGNIHNRLYLQAVVKQQATKNPRIVKPSSDATKTNPQERAVCITRLLNSHIFTEAKIKKQKNKLEAAIDLDTNQSLFQPKICREPYTPLEKPVWERLYAQTAEKVVEPEDIYKTFRTLQYRQIFCILDSDNDGKISKNSIDLSEFDERTLKMIEKILGPVAYEVEIDFEKFSELAELSIAYFSMEDRMWILRRNNACR